MTMYYSAYRQEPTVTTTTQNYTPILAKNNHHQSCSTLGNATRVSNPLPTAKPLFDNRVYFSSKPSGQTTQEQIKNRLASSQSNGFSVNRKEW